MRIRILYSTLMSLVVVSQLCYCGQYNATESWLGLLLSNANLDVISSGWNYRHKLTIQNGAYAESFSDFPVLVRLNAGRIDYAHTNVNGSDIRFTDSNGNLLDYEIEQWTYNGESIIWVRVPSITASSNNDFIYMYHGNTVAGDGQNAAGVWSSYTGVWHLKESPSGIVGEIIDSTGSYHGTTYGGMNAGNSVTGQISGALSFDGTNDYVEIAHNAAFSYPATGSFTLSAWINEGALPGSWTGIVTKSRDLGNWYGIWISSSNNWIFGASGSNQSGPAATTGWNHILIVQDATSTQRRIYVNGGAPSIMGSVANMSGTGDLWFGGAKGVSEYYSGSIDEIRIFSGAFSTARAQAEYAGVSDSYLNYGSEETLSVPRSL